MQSQSQDLTFITNEKNQNLAILLPPTQMKIKLLPLPSKL
jgi:hypothetical protein